MKTISQLKREASASLDGRWGKYAGVSLAYTLIAIAIVAIIIMVATIADGGVFDEHSPMYNTLQIVAEILIVPLSWGYHMIFLRNMRGMHDTAKTSNLFDGYKDFTRITFTMLLMGLYTFLWALLLFIPGIIKYYSYSMTYYVLHDNPELKYNGAIERSMELMKGNKMKLFLLDLSFIGWFILGLLTACIGLLWVYPYWLSTRAAFYCNLLEEESAGKPYNEPYTIDAAADVPNNNASMA